MGLVFKKSTAQPSFSVAAAITGTAEVGETLECTHTVTKAKPQNVSVAWYRYDRNDGIPPTGETLLGTGSTYVLTGNEVGKYIRAIVTASNPAGTVQSPSAYTAAVANTETPPNVPVEEQVATISGTAEVGETLTVTYDFTGEDSVAIQWYSYTSAGKTGATDLGTSSTQALTVAEDGKYIGCEVTATNTAGNYVSVADLVGRVAPDAAAAPIYTSEATVSLDEGADGYNEGEYIVCNFGVSGATELPTVAWYKCDAGKANPELLTGAGEACINPLPVSEPNNYRGALFLDQSLGLNSGGKYVYAVARAVNSEAPSGVTSESGIVGPIGAIQGTPISQTTVGDGPYVLPTADATYYLTEDISTSGTALVMNKPGQKLNLNGKTVTFVNEAPTGLVNGGFETGDFTGWDTTTAPSASIFTVTNAIDDWNLNRYNSGSYSCEFAADIHNAPYTEQYIEQANITLTRYKWYGLSVMAGIGRQGTNNNTNTIGTVFVRVYHNGILHASSEFSTTPSVFKGSQFIETVFQAWHEDPTYTVRVGVRGAANTNPAATYIDDVRLCRAQSAGIATCDWSYTIGSTPSAVSITNGGSGYADGTYTAVQSQLVSGAAASSYPKLDITVSGGVVTEASLTSGSPGGGFVANNVVVTVPASSLGNSGSGLAVTVVGLTGGAGNLRQGAFQSNYRTARDLTTRTASGGRTRTIKNGTLVTGQGVGSGINGIYLDNSLAYGGNYIAKVHRMSVTVHGYNSSALVSFAADYPAYLADSEFVAEGAINGDRDNTPGAAVFRTPGVLARCRVSHVAGAGYYTLGRPVQTLVYGSTFENKARYTNQSSLSVSTLNSEVHDCRFKSSGDNYGRCCHLGVSGSLEIYNNIFDMQGSRFNSEYPGDELGYQPAIQFESATTGGFCHFHDNEVNIYASGGLDTLGYVYTVGGLRWSSFSADATLRINNNTITATASDQAVAIPWMTSLAQSPAKLEVYDNSIITNSDYWEGASNTITRSLRESLTIQPLGTADRRLFVVQFSNISGEHLSISLVDPNMDSGTIAALVAAGTNKARRYGTGYETGRGGYRIKWTTTISTGAEGAAVVIKDAGGVTVSSGTSEANGNYVAELQQYYISGETATNTSSYTVTVNANPPVAFTADSVKTVSAPA